MNPVNIGFPTGQTPTAAQTGHIADPQGQSPTIPNFHLFQTTGCQYTPANPQPRNQLCLPTIPLELTCLATIIVDKFFFGTIANLTFCNYEQQCADLGYCIVPRNFSGGASIIIVDRHISDFISWCWIQNGIVVFVMLFLIVRPLLRTALLIGKAATTGTLDWLFDPLLSIISRDLYTLQDYVCVGVFLYGFFLDIGLLLAIRILIYPWVAFIIRQFVALEATFAAIRSIEEARRARADTPWYRWQETVHQAIYDPMLLGANDPWLIQTRIGGPVTDPRLGMPAPGALAQPLPISQSSRVARELRVGSRPDRRAHWRQRRRRRARRPSPRRCCCVAAAWHRSGRRRHHAHGHAPVRALDRGRCRQPRPARRLVDAARRGQFPRPVWRSARAAAVHVHLAAPAHWRARLPAHQAVAAQAHRPACLVPSRRRCAPAAGKRGWGGLGKKGIIKSRPKFTFMI